MLHFTIISVKILSETLWSFTNGFDCFKFVHLLFLQLTLKLNEISDRHILCHNLTSWKPGLSASALHASIAYYLHFEHVIFIEEESGKKFSVLNGLNCKINISLQLPDTRGQPLIKWVIGSVIISLIIGLILFMQSIEHIYDIEICFVSSGTLIEAFSFDIPCVSIYLCETFILFQFLIDIKKIIFRYYFKLVQCLYSCTWYYWTSD